MDTNRHRGSIRQYLWVIVGQFVVIVFAFVVIVLQQVHISNQEPILQYEPIYSSNEVLLVYSNKVTAEFAKIWGYSASRLITDYDLKTNAPVNLRFIETLFSDRAEKKAKKFLLQLHSLKELEGINFVWDSESVRSDPNYPGVVDVIGTYTFDSDTMDEPIIRKFKFTFLIASEKYLPTVSDFEWSEIEYEPI